MTSFILFAMPPKRTNPPNATAILNELIKLKSQQKYLEIGSNHNTGDGHMIDDEIRSLRLSLADDLRTFQRIADANHNDCRRQVRDFFRNQAPASDTRVDRDRRWQPARDIQTVRDEVVRLDAMIASLQLETQDELHRLRRTFAEVNGADANAGDANDMLAIEDALLLNELAAVRQWPSEAMRQRRQRQNDETAAGGANGNRMHRDVRRYLCLLDRQGGHSGPGWSDAEHQLYMRARAKCGAHDVDGIVLGMAAVVGDGECLVGEL